MAVWTGNFKKQYFILNSFLSFQYSAWWIPLCVLMGIAYAWLMYRKNGTEHPLYKWKLVLAFLRATVVAILAVLLLSPFIRSHFTNTYKPIVALLVDNSESMKHSLGKDTAELIKKIDALNQQLSSKFEVVTYNISDGLNRNSDIDFSGKTTDLSKAFTELNTTYYNQNLAGAVLISDGIYNKGTNPVYTVAESPYVIHTVAVGDTSIQRDQKIPAVYYNKIVYLNDDFSLRCDIEAGALNGKETLLEITDVTDGNAKVVQSRNINYNTDNYFQSFDFTLSTTKPGILHFRLSVRKIEGETNLKNNIRDVFIEVLDGREKVLILGNSSHPDLSALKAAIESNKNYSAEIKLADDFNQNIKEYGLIILHQLPSGIQRLSELARQIREQKKSVWFIAGSQTAYTELNKWQGAVVINANGDKTNDVTAAFNTSFSLFTMSEKCKQGITKLPPLSAPFGDFKSNPAAQVLLQQKINNVSTDYPILSFYEGTENKVAVLCAEGFWRWRLYDYSLNKSHEVTNELVNKTIQYLSLKTDKRPFRVLADKNIFGDNEAVTFQAELYNANFELVNTTDVDLAIKDANGKSMEYKFSKTNNAYVLNAGFLKEGSYTYTATAKMSGNTYTANGKFSVSPLQLEDARTRADFQVMYQLATQHRGSMHSLPQTDDVVSQLLSNNDLKPVLADSVKTENALQLKWILALLLLLLSAEWGIRKFLGSY